MRAPRYRRLNIIEPARAPHENPAGLLAMNVIAPHAQVEPSFSPYQHALWQQLQPSNRPNKYTPPLPEFWTQGHQPITPDLSHNQVNRFFQQQEWNRTFQTYHIPTHPQIHHGWGQGPLESILLSTQDVYFAPDNSELPKPLTRTSSDVSMLDESTELGHEEDIVLSNSNPPTPHKYLQSLPIEDSVLFRPSSPYQEPFCPVSPKLESLGLRQSSRTSRVSALVADRSGLSENGSQSWQQSIVEVRDTRQPSPDVLMLSPATTNTTLILPGHVAAGEESFLMAPELTTHTLANMGSNHIPTNTNEPEAQPDMLTMTDPSSPVMPMNWLMYSPLTPGVIGNSTLFTALENSAKSEYQSVGDFSFWESNCDAECFLDSGTLQDPHNGYYELFSNLKLSDGIANLSEPSQWNEGQSSITLGNSLVDDLDCRSESSMSRISGTMVPHNSFGGKECFVCNDFPRVLETSNDILLGTNDETARQVSEQGTVFDPEPEDSFSLDMSFQKPNFASGKARAANNAQYAFPAEAPSGLRDIHTWDRIAENYTSLLMAPDMVACDSSISGCSSVGPCTPHDSPNRDVYIAPLETLTFQTPSVPVIPICMPNSPGSKTNRRNRSIKDLKPRPHLTTDRLTRAVNDCLHDSCTTTDHIIETLQNAQFVIDVTNVIEVYAATREILTKLYAVIEYKHECHKGCGSWHAIQDKLLRKVRKCVNNYCKLLCSPGISPGKRMKKARIHRSKLESMIVEFEI